MIREFIAAILLFFLSSTLLAENLSNLIEIKSPEKIVGAFQKIPHYELFCHDNTWGGTEPIKVGTKFQSFLSKDFYKLFLWSQCVEPDMPPRYTGGNGVILWDIRFGFSFTGILNEQSVITRNVRVQKPKLQGSDKAIVKVLYDFNRNNTVTVYTLIREDGQWKIDDISPKGDGTEMSESSVYFSDSVKTDMQNNYNAAMKRYNKEQAQKGNAPQ
jgi:hypothetical protein